MIVFSATVTLALEVRRTDDPDPQVVEAITNSMKNLERVEAQNKLAQEARHILTELRLI